MINKKTIKMKNESKSLIRKERLNYVVENGHYVGYLVKKKQHEKANIEENVGLQGKDMPPDCDTVASTRKGSIEKFLDNLDYPDQWSYYFFLGWDCFEVDITFEPCSPETP
jgi:hypothetical protein